MTVSRSRRSLLGAATLMAAASPLLAIRNALAAGQLEKGVYRVRGDARINGQTARQGMDVRAGDTVTTGPGAEIVFVVDRDAFMVRADSRVEFLGDAGALVAAGLRVFTGKVLSVFVPGAAKRITSSTATIGIRGTAVYVEVEPDKTYACTCYGTADLEPVADPSARETVTTRYHDEPRYIMAGGAPQMIIKGPVINHTDAELTLLESLVGRRPPFGDTPGKY